MKKIIFIGLIAIAMPMLAMASNPWAERYAESREALPAELPAIEEAISTARQQTGLNNSITYDELASTISRKLEDEGAGENIFAKINRHKKNGIALTHSSNLTYEMDEITYNAHDLIWSTTLYPYDGKNPLSPIKLKGTYDEMVEVPVLTRRVRRDEIITASDVKLHNVEASRIRNDAAMKIEQIVGQTPRRTISPNRSIRLAELAKPSVVHKNDQITLQFKSGTMEIRTIGEAMQEGAEGDIIRIRNKDSHQPVQARILAAGLAEVMPLGILAQAGENY